MIPGLHHVTAIAGDPQRNYDFYTGFLGLRLVKKTVNFDDPGTYHLYFGDQLGRPGTIMTFFPWPGAQRGRAGNGQTLATAFAVPRDSLGYWMERARSFGVETGTPLRRFDEEVLPFEDPDGLHLELVGSAGEPGHAIRGFHSVTLAEEGFERTATLLTETMQFRKGPEDVNRFRYIAAAGGPASIVDVVCMPDGKRGLQGAGTVHHIAFRTPDEPSQLAWRARIAAAGLNVTPVMDRNYFRSIYFREPGGVLFEIATDPPGFTVDERVESLGAALKLPDQYEPMRARIESALPNLRTNSMIDTFHHQFIPSGHPAPAPCLLLLHGTGGGENDLLPLGQRLDPTSALLSPRGKVSENGMPRFFRRLAEGVFDIEDVKTRANELADWVDTAARTYEIDLGRIAAVGYSNGANIASAMLLLRPELLSRAILFRPMIPFVPAELPDLSLVRVLLLAGRSDPIATPEQVEGLARILRAAEADVQIHWSDAGHPLIEGDIAAAKSWLLHPPRNY